MGSLFSPCVADNLDDLDGVVFSHQLVSENASEIYVQQPKELKQIERERESNMAWKKASS